MAADQTIFRKEALDAFEAPRQEGALLNLMPGWSAPVYWFLLVTVALALGYATATSVSEYADGPAVVRIDGRLDLTTAAGGSVTGVEVHPGQHVRTGQLLVRFFPGAEQRELDRATREFELKLVMVLQDPANEAVRQSLAALRAERELIEARLSDRTVRAPSAGVVTNLRVRPGQTLTPGEVVMTLTDDRVRSFSVIALVPGRYRPMLTAGMAMRLELEGYTQAYKALVVDAVGSEAIGPAEVRRYLGQEVGDTLNVQGSMVVVRAHLPDGAFTFEGKQYRYYDGIPGRVNVRVRSIRFLVMMFPILRRVVDGEG